MRKINKRSETAIYIVSLMMAFLGETAERTAVILRSAPVSKIIDEKDLLNLKHMGAVAGYLSSRQVSSLICNQTGRNRLG